MADKSLLPHVLIVESESAGQGNLKDLLTDGSDYHVHTAVGPLQAVAALRRHPVDVIITNISLSETKSESRSGLSDYTATVILAGNGGADGVSDAIGAGCTVHHMGSQNEEGAMLSLIRNVAKRSGFPHGPSCESTGLREEYIDKLFRFAAATDVFDDNTYMHVIRIGILSRKLAELSGEDKTFCHDIKYAGMMHDVGKVGIPRSILEKRGALDQDEFDVMKTHAEIGADLLGIPDNRIISMARDIVMSHHENWDGSGYPNGLRGSEIPKSARIVAIVDMFDALLSKRSYKPRMQPEESRRIIESEDGVKCDPGLLRHLFEHFDEFLAIHRDFETKKRDELTGYLFSHPSDDIIVL